jgi:cytochrome c oxidase cbb3-type subunit 3
MIYGVTNGRINRMPAWGDFLGEAKVHLLTAYVWGLGGGVKPAPVIAPAAAEQSGTAGTPVGAVVPPRQETN